MPGNEGPWIGIVIDERTTLTLGELCRACSVHADYIIELVDEGVIEPEPVATESYRWRFSGAQIRNARIALHLHRDLGVNAAGIGVALQLLDEIEALRARLRALGRE
jgi:chaperone modulatory protein CbpM